MNPGTYKDKDGVTVVVRRTATGITVTYQNGDVKAVRA